jgi:hypothetical protein
VAASTPAPTAAVVAAVSTPSASQAQLSPWQDPQGRFSVSAPAGWQESRGPQVAFGQGIVAFRDPTGQADLDVAVDAAPGESPELYAAKMELQMQQLPGYALETTEPGMIGSSPSFRRSFTVSQQGSNGQSQNAKGFQLVVIHGNTAYILSATAPAAHYQDFSSLFNAMADSLAFP